MQFRNLRIVGDFLVLFNQLSEEALSVSTTQHTRAICNEGVAKFLFQYRSPGKSDTSNPPTPSYFSLLKKGVKIQNFC